MTTDDVEFGKVKGMGNILNPDRDNNFIRLVKFKDSEIFIDKTDFIEKMSAKINSQHCLFAVTRPRRFGKTVTAHMLSAYYSKGYAGQKIFDNLKISKVANYFNFFSDNDHTR